MVGDEMTKENLLYTRILTRLLHNRVSIEEYKHLDISLFIQTLKREGAQVFEKDGYLYWG